RWRRWCAGAHRCRTPTRKRWWPSSPRAIAEERSRHRRETDASRSGFHAVPPGSVPPYASAPPRSARHDLGAVASNDERVLVVGGQGAVVGGDRPAVGLLHGASPPRR